MFSSTVFDSDIADNSWLHSSDSEKIEASWRHYTGTSISRPSPTSSHLAVRDNSILRKIVLRDYWTNPKLPTDRVSIKVQNSGCSPQKLTTTGRREDVISVTRNFDIVLLPGTMRPAKADDMGLHITYRHRPH
eukprot:TRINITY_DN100105_c0_g1_i1.p1 TRINITY_DN100105_c0_g1~~TRINITY_DN100105_c0_g1_i1.p1  ORF type:complete len:133 (-),score=6.93 TRINITY_DN100105_c0_g1_i1:51-449(-)